MGKYRMTLRTIFTILFFLTLAHAFGQVSDSDMQQKVLRQNKVGKTSRFIHQDDSTATYLKYLGQIKSNKGDSYKIVTSTWIWGHSHRATNRILIFDSNNKYLGNYAVTMTYDLPDKIEGNKLVFLNTDNSDCDVKLVTELSFSDGIPKEFFLKCKGDMGDVYSFSTDGSTSP